MNKKNYSKLPWKSGISAFILALCCFTPLLVSLLAIVGMTGIIAYLDFALLPLLAISLLLTGYGFYKIKSNNDCCDSSINPITKK